MRSRAISPNGVLPIHRKEVKKYDFAFIGLCSIEIKTKSVLITVNNLEKHILADSSNVNVCNVGTIRCKDLVEEPTYQSQICQHMTATGLKNVLLVYSISGALIRKIVLV